MKRMIVDVSSIGWTSLMFGKDDENGYHVEHEGKKVLINSASHGFENAMDYIVGAMNRFDLKPYQMIFVVEGMNSKLLRKSMLPQYKEKGDNRIEANYTEFNLLKDQLIRTFRDLGAQVVTQDGIEADDVIAYLAANLDGEKIILSNDGDLARCIGPTYRGDFETITTDNGEKVKGLEKMAGYTHLWRKEQLDENPYGPFATKYITLYKALVGDSSDNIPGAKGFGPKAFLDLLCLFGEAGLANFEDIVKSRRIKELAEDVGELKVLQKVIDAEDMVYASYAVATLYPEKINTLRKPLQWLAGMVKPRTKDTDERVKQWAGQTRLVHKANLEQALEWMKPLLEQSPFVSLDIETSTSDESDEWLAAIKSKGTDDEKLGVDVFGSNLTSLGLTFGDNLQYTLYFTVDHRETADIKNVSKWDVLRAIKMIPNTIEMDCVVHNDSFELPVLYKEWREDEEWQNNGWRGFLPNVRDSMDCASYVNENESQGLKSLSSRLLNYRQDTYDETTVIVFDTTADGYDKAADEECSVVRGAAWPGGRVVAEGEGWVKKKYRMNELTAEWVCHYGSDDPICTAALYNHFRVIMEIEKTWEVFRVAEQKPAYLAALGFVQGTPFSLERLKELEKEDDKVHAENWAVVRDFLMQKGWEGTVCPVYEEITPAAVKEAVKIVTGLELKTQVRTVSKFPALVRQLAEIAQGEGDADYKVVSRLEFIAQAVEKGELDSLNKIVSNYFSGEPEINFDSPKQMQNLLYHVLDLPVRICNKLTPKERQEKPELAKAVSQFNKICQGSKNVAPLTDEQKELLKLKAATDDTAVDFALAYDCPEGSEARKVLEAMTAVKTVETRRKLYYRPYPLLRHWIDNKLHPSLNQNRAVTRRFSDSGPNRQQLPKKGEGVKVREIIVPHKKNAVIVSIDFSGQELRLMAGQSMDENMLACYIGEKLKDIHSITASGAMPKKWGKEQVQKLADELGMSCESADALYELFMKLRKHEDKVIAKKADDLRKDGKNVNFAAQFDAQALKVSHMTIMPVEDAQAFLDAKYAMFPRVETWKEEVRQFVMKHGYATTMMGARRHLRDSVLSDDKWIAEKAGRQGPNFKIQGSAAEMTKMSMARFWDTGAMFKYDAVFIAPIHDELVASVAIEDAVEFIREMHWSMTQPYADLCVPVVGSISLGPNFGIQYEAGDAFDAERISEIIETIKEKHFGWTLAKAA